MLWREEQDKNKDQLTRKTLKEKTQQQARQTINHQTSETKCWKCGYSHERKKCPTFGFTCYKCQQGGSRTMCLACFRDHIFCNHCNIRFENTSKYVDTLTLFSKNLNQRSLTPKWPLTRCLLRSHVTLYPRIIVSKSHDNTSMYVDTVINFAKYHIHTYTVYYVHRTYYVQNEWSHSLLLNSVQARQKPNHWAKMCKRDEIRAKAADLVTTANVTEQENLHRWPVGGWADCKVQKRMDPPSATWRHKNESGYRSRNQSTTAEIL